MARMIFNFELHVTTSEVSVVASPVGGRVRGTFKVPMSWERCTSFSSSEQPLNEMRQVGECLFHALFYDDNIRHVYEQSRLLASDEGLRFKLRVDKGLEALPWELLRDPNKGFLALSPNYSVVRYQPMPLPVTPLNVSGPLRLLIVGGYASDGRIEAQVEALRLFLAPLEKSGRLEISLLPRASISNLTETLQNKNYHLLHYIGEQLSEAPEPWGGLSLWDHQEEQGIWVASLQLWRLLRQSKTLRLIWLDAAEKEQTLVSQPLERVAVELVRAGIPAVMTNQCSAFCQENDASFIESDLAAHFYSSLAEGVPIDQALTNARILAKQSAPHLLTWASPALFTHVSDGMLFELSHLPIRKREPIHLPTTSIEEIHISHQKLAQVPELRPLLSQSLLHVLTTIVDAASLIASLATVLVILLLGQPLQPLVVGVAILVLLMFGTFFYFWQRDEQSAYPEIL